MHDESAGAQLHHQLHHRQRSTGASTGASVVNATAPGAVAPLLVVTLLCLRLEDRARRSPTLRVHRCVDCRRGWHSWADPEKTSPRPGTPWVAFHWGTIAQKSESTHARSQPGSIGDISRDTL